MNKKIEITDIKIQAVVVIDLSNSTLTILDVFDHWDSEQIEDYLDKQGFHLSNCSWGCFDGTIIDQRDE